MFKVLREFDPWKNPLCTCPKKYSLSPYTGCSHGCLYCYITSYIKEKESKPKKDFLINLEKDLKLADKNLYISMANSSDPYPPIEEKLELTRKTIEIIKKHKFKLLILTKSNLVTRDIDLLKNMRCVVSITITTLNKKISRKIEPGAPNPNERLEAIEELNKNNIPVVVRVDPIIPYVNSYPEEIEELIKNLKERGVSHIVTSTYKAKWDGLNKLKKAFGDEIYKLYKKEGKYFHGYIYLNKKLRKEMLKPVFLCCKKHKISLSLCREGFYFEKNEEKIKCDGSHLFQISSNKRFSDII